jgi:hypothetical protein
MTRGKDVTSMIAAIIDRFESQKSVIRAAFAAERPSSYLDIVTAVVKALHDPEEYRSPDPDRITQIDHGDYQGTLVFVIGCTGYQPSTYWGVTVSYGSCSGCDTLQAIHDYGSDKPTDSELDQYMTLALHIVQGLKEF